MDTPIACLAVTKKQPGALKDRAAILEFALRQPICEKIGPIIAAKPRILALSVSIWNHQATMELLEALEKEFTYPEPVIVLGGPEVSWLPENSGIFRHADYVIRGEGEESFRILCEKIFAESDFSQAQFTVEKQRSNITADKKPVFINKGETTVDINKINTAYHLYTEEDLERKLVYVEASRGCPFNCEFCTGSTKNAERSAYNSNSILPFSVAPNILLPVGKQQVREFPIEPFLADMKMLIEKGGRIFKFLDRTFNLKIDRAKRIMEFFLEKIDEDFANLSKDNQIKDRQLCVHFEMVPSLFPAELKEIIKRFPPGSLRIEVGIQTLNTETASLVHCSAAFDKEIETIQFLRKETNAIVHADLIAGLPGESFASFGIGFDKIWQALSMEGCQNLNPQSSFEIQLGILKCLPGTPITRHTIPYGMRYSGQAPYEVIETGALSVTDLNRIKNFARFWELIVNRDSFPDLVPQLFPPDQPVFDRFMELSDKLLEKFGRNWGIDKYELLSFLEKYNACA